MSSFESLYLPKRGALIDFSYSRLPIREYSKGGKICDIHNEQFILLRSRECNMQMDFLTIWR